MLSEYIIARGSQLTLNILECPGLIFMVGCSLLSIVLG